MLVQAIVARHSALARQGQDLKVVIIVPGEMDPFSSYLTRRAWLHFALSFVDGTTNIPYCNQLVYNLGAGDVAVVRNACGANWNVNDCFNPAAPAATDWLERDTLVYDAGAGPVTVPLHRIRGVDCGIHFYSPEYRHGVQNRPYNNIYTHSKVAAFDDQWLVVGSANWSYRSMVYDAEISAFIDSAPITTAAVAGLLTHYQTGFGAVAPTPATVEATALGNAAVPSPNAIRLYPLELYNPALPLGPNNPRRPLEPDVPPAPGLGNFRQFIANPSIPNYRWL